jgi:hypothetical protein
MKGFLFLLVFLCSFKADASFLYKDLEFIGMENFSVVRKDGKIFIGFEYVINYQAICAQINGC